MQVGERHDRFCDPLATDTARTGCVWLIVDRLTKSAHFLALRMTFTLERFHRLYIREIVRLYGVPKRGVVRFGKRGKLSQRFNGPFEILERVGTIAYRLALPPSMSGVYEEFHVFMLWRYTPDPAHVVDLGEIELTQMGPSRRD